MFPVATLNLKLSFCNSFLSDLLENGSVGLILQDLQGGGGSGEEKC
jgi:hypothetical protein